MGVYKVFQFLFSIVKSEELFCKMDGINKLILSWKKKAITLVVGKKTKEESALKWEHEIDSEDEDNTSEMTHFVKKMIRSKLLNNKDVKMF